MVCATIDSTGGERGGKKESKWREGGWGGGKKSRQEREWPAGTEQQLVFDSEREKRAKEKAARGERERERREKVISRL